MAGANPFVSTKQVEDAFYAARKALDSYTQPEEVRPGLWLCCRGRIYRAFHIAGQQPNDKWPAIEAEIKRLCAIELERLIAYNKAVETYHKFCAQAQKTPQPIDSKRCTCEGCQIDRENERARNGWNQASN